MIFKREEYLQSDRNIVLRSLCLELVVVTELLLYQQDISMELLLVRQRELLAQLVAQRITPGMHVGENVTVGPDFYAEYLAGQLLGASDSSGAWQGILSGVEMGFAFQPEEKELFKDCLIRQNKIVEQPEK